MLKLWPVISPVLLLLAGGAGGSILANYATIGRLDERLTALQSDGTKLAADISKLSTLNAKIASFESDLNSARTDLNRLSLLDTTVTKIETNLRTLTNEDLLGERDEKISALITQMNENTDEKLRIRSDLKSIDKGISSLLTQVNVNSSDKLQIRSDLKTIERDISKLREHVAKIEGIISVKK